MAHGSAGRLRFNDSFPKRVPVARLKLRVTFQQDDGFESRLGSITSMMQLSFSQTSHPLSRLRMASKKRVRQQTLTYSLNLWMTHPTTIAWLRDQRDKALHLASLLRTDINGTIILLTASCVEGFLTECLKAFRPRSVKHGFQGRLLDEFYRRAAKSGFRELNRLFEVVTGVSVDSLTPTRKTAIGRLFDLRNLLAHSRPIEINVFWSGGLNFEHEFDDGDPCRKVEAYLLGQKILKAPVRAKCEATELLSSPIADHFSALLEPILREITAALPAPQSEYIAGFLKHTFDNRPQWAYPYRDGVR